MGDIHMGDIHMVIRFRLEKVTKGLIFQILEVLSAVAAIRNDDREWRMSNGYLVSMVTCPELDCHKRTIYIIGEDDSKDSACSVEKYASGTQRDLHYDCIIFALREWVMQMQLQVELVPPGSLPIIYEF